MTQHTLELHGCTTYTLMSYLKSLGVMSVLGKIDKETKARWFNNRLTVMQSKAESPDSLISTIATQYTPSTVLCTMEWWMRLLQEMGS